MEGGFGHTWETLAYKLKDKNYKILFLVSYLWNKNYNFKNSKNSQKKIEKNHRGKNSMRNLKGVGGWTDKKSTVQTKLIFFKSNNQNEI